MNTTRVKLKHTVAPSLRKGETHDLQPRYAQTLAVGGYAELVPQPTTEDGQEPESPSQRKKGGRKS